jgi:hypothetical protein
MRCYHCQREVDTKERIGRGETCPGCEANLRCCRNCLFYDTSYASACREPQAEPVVDKEAGNFCDFFVPGERQAQPAVAGTDARARLEALFKKKG